MVGIVLALSAAMIPPSRHSDPACWLPGSECELQFRRREDTRAYSRLIQTGATDGSAAVKRAIRA